jgi:MFS transporter, putative metabolite:H+ symporter
VKAAMQEAAAMAEPGVHAAIQTPALISARLDRLPPCGPVWRWLIIISFGAFFEIYETALSSLLAPLLRQAGIFHGDRSGLFGLPDLATFAFATFIGLFVGSLLFSALADRIGRRPIFTYSLVWYALATVVMAFRADAAWICLWRFIAAIGVGAEIVAVDAYVSEMMPKAIRGRGFALCKAMQFLAVPVAGILAALQAHRAGGGIAGWRVMLLVPSIGAALIWWVRRGLPESPRWLAQRGRLREADAIVTAMEQRIGRLPECVLGSVQTPPPSLMGSNSGFVELFRGELLRRTLMLVVGSCAVTIAVYGFGNWLPSLLQDRGVNVSSSLTYTSLIALSYPVSPYLASRFADRLERKWQIVLAAGFTAIAGLAFSGQTTSVGWIACGVAITLGNALAASAVHTYRSELYPTAVRARGIGLVYSIDRLSAAFNSYVVGLILLQLGTSGVLTFIAGAMVVAMVVFGVWGPATRQLATEAIRNG